MGQLSEEKVKLSGKEVNWCRLGQLGVNPQIWEIRVLDQIGKLRQLDRVYVKLG